MKKKKKLGPNSSYKTGPLHHTAPGLFNYKDITEKSPDPQAYDLEAKIARSKAATAVSRSLIPVPWMLPGAVKVIKN